MAVGAREDHCGGDTSRDHDGDRPEDNQARVAASLPSGRPHRANRVSAVLPRASGRSHPGWRAHQSGCRIWRAGVHLLLHGICERTEKPHIWIAGPRHFRRRVIWYRVAVVTGIILLEPEGRTQRISELPATGITVCGSLRQRPQQDIIYGPRKAGAPRRSIGAER